MSKDEPNLKACACATRMADLLRATPAKRDWLRKTTCPNARRSTGRIERQTTVSTANHDRSSEAGVT